MSGSPHSAVAAPEPDFRVCCVCQGLPALRRLFRTSGLVGLAAGVCTLGPSNPAVYTS